jgi:SET and MYND domain-containing protein
LYRLIYPPNYPQIGASLFPSPFEISYGGQGMHLLELAKTYWNSIVSGNMDTIAENVVKQECWTYLNEAKNILQILGAEGDEDGPLVEISTLETLLQ